MRAAVLEQLDAPLTVADVELGPVSIGQVLVRVLVSGICGSQLQEIAGNKGNAKFLPHLLGHEGCGMVEQIGPGVTTVKPGDKVVMHWRKGDGVEADFPLYRFRNKAMRGGKVTTFNQYAIVSENRITAVPADTPDDLCALLGCGLSTALGTIIDEAKVRPGESVLVVGLGGLGASLVRVARLIGASPVTAIDVHETKRSMAGALGADLFLNATTDDAYAKARELLGVREYDVIIETSGNVASIEKTLPLLGSGGRFIMIGQPAPGASVTVTNALHLFGGEGKSVTATQGGRFSPTRDIPRYVRMAQAGRLRFDDLISHRTKLEDINDAIGLMRSGKANRVLIDLWT